MDVEMIIAIVRSDKLEEVEKRLRELGVDGISVSKVKGYGEYRNFFAPDWMTEEVRLEIFAPSAESERIARAVMESGRSGRGMRGDGIVAIVPARVLRHIRSGA